MADLRKKINRFDSFTKCRALVLGNINWSLLDIIEDKEKKAHCKRVLDSLDQTLKDVEKICHQFGIHVDKPIPVPYSPKKTYSTPYFDLKAIKNTVSPFDSFLCLADTIVEVGSVTENAFFDYVQYRHIWEQYFDQGSNWIASPIPTHNPHQHDGFDYYDYAEPLFDGPCVEPIGNVALIPSKMVINVRAKKWLARTFPQFKFVEVEDTVGHLDSYFRVLKPGLVFSSMPKQALPDIFKNWDVIVTSKTQYKPPEIVNEFVQDDDYENTTLDVNGFSLDEENFMLMEHVWQHHPDTVKQIESHGINCIPVAFSSCNFINQGLSCIMNPTIRDGVLTDYFK